MIRYKVVKDNYNSIVIDGRSPFCLKYEVGTTVFADKSTLGIMLFDTLMAALAWASWNEKILKVETIGRGKRPTRIGGVSSTQRLREFYSDMNATKYPTFYPPSGTICYHGVTVIEEVR